MSQSAFVPSSLHTLSLKELDQIVSKVQPEQQEAFTQRLWRTLGQHPNSQLLKSFLQYSTLVFFQLKKKGKWIIYPLKNDRNFAFEKLKKLQPSSALLLLCLSGHLPAQERAQYLLKLLLSSKTNLKKWLLHYLGENALGLLCTHQKETRLTLIFNTLISSSMLNHYKTRMDIEWLMEQIKQSPLPQLKLCTRLWKDLNPQDLYQNQPTLWFPALQSLWLKIKQQNSTDNSPEFKSDVYSFFSPFPASELQRVINRLSPHFPPTLQDQELFYFWSNYLSYIKQFWIICGSENFEEECHFASQSLLFGRSCIHQNSLLEYDQKWLLLESTFGLIGIHYTHQGHVQTYLLNTASHPHLTSLDAFDSFLSNPSADMVWNLEEDDHLWQNLLMIKLFEKGVEPSVNEDRLFRINESDSRVYYTRLGLHFTSKEIVRNPSQFTQYLRQHPEHLDRFSQRFGQEVMLPLRTYQAQKS